MPLRISAPWFMHKRRLGLREMSTPLPVHSPIRASLLCRGCGSRIPTRSGELRKTIEPDTETSAWTCSGSSPRVTVRPWSGPRPIRIERQERWRACRTPSSYESRRDSSSTGGSTSTAPQRTAATLCPLAGGLNRRPIGTRNLQASKARSCLGGREVSTKPAAEGSTELGDRPPGAS